MFYSSNLYLFTDSGVQHILCCVFVLLPVSLGCLYLTSNDLQITTPKTKDRTTRTPLKVGDELK